MARVKSRKPASLAVRHHTPRRIWVLRALVLLVFIAATLASFEYGRQSAGYYASQTNAMLVDLHKQLAQAQANNTALREQVALLEQSRSIDQQARDQVQTRLADVQDEILQLREELAFYRGIVSPQDSESGLKVQNFSLASGSKPRQYQFKLVLIQAISHDEQVQGHTNIIFHGLRNGETASLSIDELMPEETSLNFAFKYFQDFEGMVRLPADFSPQRVEVIALPGGRSDAAVRKTYEWQTLLKK